MIKRLLALVLSAAAWWPIAAVNAAAMSLDQIVDNAAARIMSQQHIPGLAVAVVQHGRVVAERGFGVADRTTKKPVSADMQFEIGSITKQFTAACIMQLARAGKLGLDDPLGRYVPQYGAGAAVTVRQLLGQTSGIPEYLQGDDVLAAAAKPNATVDTLLARVAAKPLVFAPGSRWMYSNTNYILLTAIVERASGTAYRDYVRAHIFVPAGMTSSGFIGDANLHNVASGYTAASGSLAAASPLRYEWAAGAGAIVSTVGDLAKWNAALLNGRIVDTADVALMRSPLTPMQGGALPAYGFGWIVDAVGTHPRVWHNGGTFGFASVNVTYPSDDEAIIVLTNVEYAHPEALAAAIFEGQHPELAAAAAVAAPGEDTAVTARVLEWFKRFQTGDIDRAQLTESMSTALTPALVEATKTGFSQLGMPTSTVYRGSDHVGGATNYHYALSFAAGTFNVDFALAPDGRIAGYLVRPG